MAIVAMLTMTASANAMSYEQARREALFLTDKMAYELNLTDEQYDAAYEINLDYLMGVTSRDDVYGTYWTRRNLDFSYILLESQWLAFQAATYFYRPLYWSAGCWHFGIYARYPRRDYFYFSRPTVYISYRGGHSWHHNGGRSYYYPRRDRFSHNKPNGGMRDRWDRGDFHHRTGGGKNSSTHVTVNRGENKGNASGFGGNRTNGALGNNSNKGTNTTHGTTTRPQTNGVTTHNGSFGGNRSTAVRRSAGITPSNRITNSVKQQTTTRPISIDRTTGSVQTKPSTTGLRRYSGTGINRSTGTVRSTTPGLSRNNGGSSIRRNTSSGGPVKSAVRGSVSSNRGSGGGGSNGKGSFGGRR